MIQLDLNIQINFLRIKYFKNININKKENRSQNNFIQLAYFKPSLKMTILILL